MNVSTQTHCKIGIQNLAISCIIGALSTERFSEQKIYVNIEVEYNAKDLEKDALASVLDYRILAQRATALAKEGRFRLIEAYADRLLCNLLFHPLIQWAKVEVKKPSALSDADYCFIQMERRR